MVLRVMNETRNPLHTEHKRVIQFVQLSNLDDYLIKKKQSTENVPLTKNWLNTFSGASLIFSLLAIRFRMLKLSIIVVKCTYRKTSTVEQMSRYDRTRSKACTRI